MRVGIPTVQRFAGAYREGGEQDFGQCQWVDSEYARVGRSVPMDVCLLGSLTSCLLCYSVDWLIRWLVDWLIG